MQEDVTRLVLEVRSDQVDKADRRLKQLGRTGGQTEKATDRLRASFTRLIGPLVGIATAAAGLRKLVGITREFDVLNAQLVTATGSADGAAVAFEAIQDFASSTPFDLAQVTTAFQKLVNLGLAPSEEALTSYGDTASAMGKDLDQLIEAVADAATGEFERLKEFGIKARSQGDEVGFTFRGVTTVVKKESAEIEQYLIALGQNNFAGAMTERMNTLDGALSNLGDEWDKFWLNISQSGSGDVIEDIVRGAIGSLEEMNAMLASGQAEAYLDAILFKFSSLADGAVNAIESITWVIETASEYWGGSGSDAVSTITDAFVNMPENIRALIQLVGAEIAFLVEYGKIAGSGMVEVIVAEFMRLVELAGAYGRQIGDALNPFDGDTYDLEANIARINKLYSEVQVDAMELSDSEKSRLSALKEAREEVVSSILDERDASIKSFQDQISQADHLRARYDAVAAARKNATGDRLAGFKFDAGEQGPTGPSAEDLKAEKAVEKIRQQLLTEEEAIAESYHNRRDIILGSTLTTEEQKLDLLDRLETQYQQQQKDAQLDRWKTSLSAFDDFQDNMLVLAKTGNKDLANVFKAAAIANAVVKTYESATSAYASLAPIPYVGPALGAAAAAAAIAAGMANVSAIRNQQVGQYTGGGIVPGNSPTGDNLNAGVNSGEMILNTGQQRQLFDMANGRGQGSAAPVVKIINLPGQAAETRTNEAGELEVIIKRTQQAVAGDLSNGGGPVDRALDSALSRRRVLR